ncbi:MAG: YciI family protein [Myxococcota bacterium]
MGEYLVLVHEDERAHLAQAPRAMAELLSAQSRYGERLHRDGRSRGSGRLRPSDEGRRVGRTTTGEVGVDRGPYADDGRCLALYYWVRASTLDEAKLLASECPVLPTDHVEVREVTKGRAPEDPRARTGRVFGFAVLGRAASIDDWNTLMDHIDRESAEVTASFLGGVRLRAPDPWEEGRGTFDGPFLESKEVLGGLFFLRLSALEDAVDWAARSPYAVHGRLEVRELWRS